MTTFFMLTAIVGGALLACQLVMTLIGLGGHDLDGSHDMASDMGDGDGHDLTHDTSDSQGTEHADVEHAGHAHHGSTWLFGLLSLRTLTAGLTFFGLAGLTAESAGWSLGAQFGVAVVAGGAALALVRWILKQFRRLNEDDTVRIQRAIGKFGTVYIPIPAGKNGRGKVQLELQGRLMEYEAVTADPANLATGAKVTVTGIVGPSTLEVRAIDVA